MKGLSPSALSAAMRGGTSGWGEHGSSNAHIRYAESQNNLRRKKCHCGCGARATHRGMANGVCLRAGCEMSIRRWVKGGN